MRQRDHFLDQPWSAQDERQIRGRAHRQPQKKVVKIYHLPANDTADVIMAGLAQGKQSMMEAFLQKEGGEDMYQVLLGKSILGSGDDEDDENLRHRGVAVASEQRKEKGKEKQLQDRPHQSPLLSSTASSSRQKEKGIGGASIAHMNPNPPIPASSSTSFVISDGAADTLSNGEYASSLGATSGHPLRRGGICT